MAPHWATVPLVGGPWDPYAGDLPGLALHAVFPGDHGQRAYRAKQVKSAYMDNGERFCQTRNVEAAKCCRFGR